MYPKFSGRFFWRLIFDCLLLFCIGFVALIAVPQLMPPYSWTQKRGFFCSDLSLQYPRTHQSTLGSVMKSVIVVAIPSGLSVAVEMLRASFETSFSRRPQRQLFFMGIALPTFISECYKLVGVYYFGLALQHIFGEITKRQVGRLRPTFLVDCRPQLLDGSTCEDSENSGRFIEDYICSEAGEWSRGTSPEHLLSVRHSFPSAFVTAVAYAMSFLIMYMQERLRAKGFLRLLRIVLQFFFAMVVVAVACERVYNHQHHVSDVLAGSLIGIACGVFVAVTVAGLCEHESESKFNACRTKLVSPPCLPMQSRRVKTHYQCHQQRRQLTPDHY